MKLFVYDTEKATAQGVAERLGAAVRVTPTLVLGLPTGRTPIPIYRRLAVLRAEGADFSRVTTFNLDEFIGLAPAHPASYRAFMLRHFADPLGLDARQMHFLDGTAADLPAECRRYEAAIAAAGGIGLQLLGIGMNGHIGFNEPAAALEARTHVARLTAQTRRANALFFDGQLDRVPETALSMGIGTILQARRVIIVATGRSKRHAVARMLCGRVSTRTPASFLQLHDDVEAHLDADAAAALETAAIR